MKAKNKISWLLSIAIATSYAVFPLNVYSSGDSSSNNTTILFQDDFEGYTSGISKTSETYARYWNVTSFSDAFKLYAGYGSATAPTEAQAGYSKLSTIDNFMSVAPSTESGIGTGSSLKITAQSQLISNQLIKNSGITESAIADKKLVFKTTFKVPNFVGFADGVGVYLGAIRNGGGSDSSLTQIHYTYDSTNTDVIRGRSGELMYLGARPGSNRGDAWNAYWDIGTRHNQLWTFGEKVADLTPGTEYTYTITMTPNGTGYDVVTDLNGTTVTLDSATAKIPTIDEMKAYAVIGVRRLSVPSHFKNGHTQNEEQITFADWLTTGRGSTLGITTEGKYNDDRVVAYFDDMSLKAEPIPVATPTPTPTIPPVSDGTVFSDDFESYTTGRVSGYQNTWKKAITNYDSDTFAWMNGETKDYSTNENLGKWIKNIPAAADARDIALIEEGTGIGTGKALKITGQPGVSNYSFAKKSNITADNISGKQLTFSATFKAPNKYSIYGEGFGIWVADDVESGAAIRYMSEDLGIIAGTGELMKGEFMFVGSRLDMRNLPQDRATTLYVFGEKIAKLDCQTTYTLNVKLIPDSNGSYDAYVTLNGVTTKLAGTNVPTAQELATFKRLYANLISRVWTMENQGGELWKTMFIPSEIIDTQNGYKMGRTIGIIDDIKLKATAPEAAPTITQPSPKPTPAPDSQLGNVLVLGDSISTFAGEIAENCAPYYNPWSDWEGSGVTSVDKTWWAQVLDSTKSILALNSSSSGSTICVTNEASQSKSFVERIKALVDDGFFTENNINTVFIHGGTNDSESPVGELKYSDWTNDDIKNLRPALCYMLDMIKTNAPSARIIFIQNQGLTADVRNSIKDACDYYNAERIELANITCNGLHPTAAGMTQIANRIIGVLDGSESPILPPPAVNTVTIIDGTGSGTYTEGETVNITANAKAGFDFSRWNVTSANVTLADENSAQTTFVMPAEAVTIEAEYTPINAISGNVNYFSDDFEGYTQIDGLAGWGNKSPSLFESDTFKYFYGETTVSSETDETRPYFGTVVGVPTDISQIESETGVGSGKALKITGQTRINHYTMLKRSNITPENAVNKQIVFETTFKAPNPMTMGEGFGVWLFDDAEKQEIFYVSDDVNIIKGTGDPIKHELLYVSSRTKSPSSVKIYAFGEEVAIVDHDTVYNYKLTLTPNENGGYIAVVTVNGQSKTLKGTNVPTQLEFGTYNRVHISPITSEWYIWEQGFQRSYANIPENVKGPNGLYEIGRTLGIIDNLSLKGCDIFEIKETMGVNSYGEIPITDSAITLKMSGDIQSFDASKIIINNGATVTAAIDGADASLLKLTFSNLKAKTDYKISISSLINDMGAEFVGELTFATSDGVDVLPIELNGSATGSIDTVNPNTIRVNVQKHSSASTTASPKVIIFVDKVIDGAYKNVGVYHATVPATGTNDFAEVNNVVVGVGEVIRVFVWNDNSHMKPITNITIFD